MSVSQFRPTTYPALIVALTAAVLTLASAQVHARIYKWTDPDGNTVYSETPPPRGVEAERIKEAPPPAEDPEAAMESLRERAKAFEEREESRDESEQESAAEADRAEQQKKVCEKLRENLQVLQTNNQVREQSDDGEFVTLGEEQRQARIESTQKRIADECGG